MALAFVHRRGAVCALLAVIAASTAAHAARSQPARHVVRTSTTYTSKRYSYEITLRGRYTMYPAAARWVGDFPFGSSGQVDLIADWQDRKFIVAAKPVSPGMSLPRWEAFVVKVKRQACHALRHFRATSLGGAPAREFVNSCPAYDVSARIMSQRNTETGRPHRSCASRSSTSPAHLLLP